MEFGVLGPFAVRDGGPVAIPRGKPPAVLLALLLHRNEVVSFERLIDEVWGETAPRTANKTLQLYVSQLRKMLPSGVLVTQPAAGYILRVSDDEIDAGRFERLLADGRDRRPGDARAADPETGAVPCPTAETSNAIGGRVPARTYLARWRRSIRSCRGRRRTGVRTRLGRGAKTRGREHRRTCRPGRADRDRDSRRRLTGTRRHRRRLPLDEQRAGRDGVASRQG